MMMTRSALLILTLLVTASIGCEQIDEFNDLLPMVEGARWEWDSDADDAVWFVEISAGDGHDEDPSYDFTFAVRVNDTDTPQFPHDLYDGEEGWHEVDPSEEQPLRFLKLPAEEGLSWDFLNIGTGNESTSVMTYEGRGDVSVPAGDFEQCWELSRDKVSTYGATEFTSLFVDWYCPGHGLVKRSMTNTDGEITVLTLTSYDIPETE
jgi:rubredoxin